MINFSMQGWAAATKDILDLSRLDKLGMKQVAEMGRQDVLDHFSKTEAPSGSWAPVKRGGKPLQDTGRLRGSIRQQSTTYEARVTANTDYAAVHNFGSKPGKGKNIKQREYMWLSDKKKEEIEKTVAKNIETSYGK